MKIVVDISENMYKNLVKRNTDIVNYYEYAIYLGTVLPEHTEPKTGHWIETDKYESYRYRCSECCRGSDDITDYCPNCGARMVEPQESEEV